MKFLVLLSVLALATPATFAVVVTKKRHKHEMSSSTSTTTSTSTSTTTTEAPDGAQEIPYFYNIEIIRIRVPISSPSAGNDTSRGPYSGQTESTTARSAAESPEPSGDDTGTSEPASPPQNTSIILNEELVIPDVATFEAIFSNKSALGNTIRVFAFGGEFELFVNRTSDMVEVVMVKTRNSTSEEDQKSASDGRLLQWGPRILQMKLSRAGHPGHRGHPGHLGHPGHPGHGLQGARLTKGDKEEQEPEASDDQEEDEDSAQEDQRPAAEDKFDAIVVNGASLAGVTMGVVTYNTSGTFALNMSLADDFMSVIIAKISDKLREDNVTQDVMSQAQLVHPAPQDSHGQFMLRMAAPLTDESGTPSGGHSVTTVALAAVALGAVATLAAAILVWRRRARAQQGTFVRREYLPLQ